MGHQGGKIPEPDERLRYFTWLDHLEFDILDIPRPDLNIVLLMPSAQAQTFVDQKAKRAYTHGKKRDLHESNLDHLTQAEQTYREICHRFPDAFTPIECSAGHHILSLDHVQDQIRQQVTTLLADPTIQPTT
jgi:dTMP kinase